MSKESTGEVTVLLRAARKGESRARDELFRIVYRELRAIARRELSRERVGHTLDTGAVAHEACLKIFGRLDEIEDRRQFFSVAATSMRRILVDHARRRLSKKRGEAPSRVALTDDMIAVEATAAEVLDVDASMERLRAISGRLAQVVELRFFVGLSVEETAEAVGVTDRTIKRDWRKARALLWHMLHDESDPARRKAS